MTFVRPGLEYCSEIWNPHLIRDIEVIERVQRLFTRRIPGLSSFSYEQRLRHLNLKTLKHRRTEKDLIFVFKMIHGMIDLSFDDFFEFSENRTRGHIYKIAVKRSRLDVHKYFFASRIIPIWNSLPPEIVDSPSLAVFRSRVKGISSFENLGLRVR